MSYYWESYDKEKLDDHIMGWRDRAYVAEKFVSRLLGIDLNQAVAESRSRLSHPLGKEEAWKGEHHEWISANIIVLEGALARLRHQAEVLKSGAECPCADCRGAHVDLDKVPPDIEGRRPDFLAKYLALVRKLFDARAAAGDHLSEAEEDRFAQDLEDVWTEMTDAERTASEEPIEAMKRETEPKWSK